MATANQIRQVAIEIIENITAIKTAVDAVKTAVDAINTVASAWIVNVEDASLPTQEAVKTQLEAYEALSVAITKPGNVLTDSITAVKTLS